MDINNYHDELMHQALKYAQMAQELGEVPIGALITDANGAIISYGYNQPIKAHDPTAHAEIMAIRMAAQKLENYRTKPALSLYVTLEPCTMCAGAISFARVENLIFGAYDAKGGAIVNGAQFFNSPSCHFRPKILHGILEYECSNILRDFFRAKRNKNT